MKKLQGRNVEVYDGNVEKALRKFKRRVVESGVLFELRERETYTKPSVQRKIERAQAKKRWQRHLAQQTPPKRHF